MANPQLGELTKAIAEDTAKNIEQILAEKRHLSHYYIFVHQRFHGNVLNEKIVIMPQRPVPMLASWALEVDNRSGTLILLWKLPLDIPLDGVPLEGFDPNVAQAAKDLNMPIAYN